jgi:eukaryotic-like serine/threonine-protein kinase
MKRGKTDMNESIEWILQLNLTEQEETELREILDAFSDSKSRSEWEDISLKEQLAVFAYEHNIALNQIPSLQTIHTHTSNSLITDVTWNSHSISLEHTQETQSRKLSRFVDDSLLGIGGMGEVRKVFDPDLSCSLAMKIMHKRLLGDDIMTQRFHQEARIIASLQHPSIPPVHEIGMLEDGRPFFTMREIRGNSLANILRNKREGTEDWNLRKLISIFQQVCSTIAFAHAQNIIHRDLKPANIMVGEFGEVLVVDWGLAKIIQSTTNTLKSSSLIAVPPSNLMTMWGTVQGTPAYMSPEQAKGESLDERSDVYALGSILFEILSGRPPFVKDPKKKEHASNILEKVINDEPPFTEVNSNTKNPVPTEMIDICKLSMIKDSTQRTTSAADLSKYLENWLDGIKQKEKAKEFVRQAQDLRECTRSLVEKSNHAKQQAQNIQLSLNKDAKVQDKYHMWDKEDEALQLLREANLTQSQCEHLLQSALTCKPDYQDAHAILAEIYCERHRDAEQNHDILEEARFEELLTHHTQALLEQHPQRKYFVDYLAGQGRIQLELSENLDVVLEKYVAQNRRYQPILVERCDKNSLLDKTLPIGKYRLRFPRTDGSIIYPIIIRRQETWTSPNPITIPKNSTDRKLVYVPEGQCEVGHISGLHGAWMKQNIHVDSFWIQRYPVTHQEYLDFLNNLVDQGKRTVASQCTPTNGDIQIYGRVAGGHYFLCPDVQGRMIDPNTPVTCIDWYSATQYAKWKSIQDGMRWRLPWGVEWEKAARGVDGRHLPWGDFMEPSWCATLESGCQTPQPIDSFPIDHSPYGVRGMAGNVCDWVLDSYNLSNPNLKITSLTNMNGCVRGGAWNKPSSQSALYSRNLMERSQRNVNVGFRLLCQKM